MLNALLTGCGSQTASAPEAAPKPVEETPLGDANAVPSADNAENEEKQQETATEKRQVLMRRRQPLLTPIFWERYGKFRKIPFISQKQKQKFWKMDLCRARLPAPMRIFLIPSWSRWCLTILLIFIWGESVTMGKTSRMWKPDFRIWRKKCPLIWKAALKMVYFMPLKYGCPKSPDIPAVL